MARGRRFPDAEHARIKVMIAEGYADRPFCDLTIDTGQTFFDATVRELAYRVGQLAAG